MWLEGCINSTFDFLYTNTQWTATNGKTANIIRSEIKNHEHRLCKQ